MYFGGAARFVEAGIHHWFKENQFSFLNPGAEKVFWVVRELHILYSKRISFGETIMVTTRLEHVGRFYLSFSCHFMGEDQETRLTATLRLVFIDNEQGKPLPLPHDLVATCKKEMTHAC